MKFLDLSVTLYNKTADIFILTLDSYLKGTLSSSFQLGLGPSATLVAIVLRWNMTSTKGRTNT